MGAFTLRDYHGWGLLVKQMLGAAKEKVTNLRIYAGCLTSILSISLALAASLLLYSAKHCLAAEANTASEALKPFYDISLKLPEGFKLMEAASQSSILLVTAPFTKTEKLVKLQRFMRHDLFYTSIITMVYDEKYDGSTFALAPAELSKGGLELVASEPKVFGAKGQIFHIRQFAEGAWFYKIICVFGNATQTNIVVTAFPADRYEQMKHMMIRVVEWARFPPQ